MGFEADRRSGSGLIPSVQNGSGDQTVALTAVPSASRRPRTTATIASWSFSLFTAEPTPTPAAPAAIAIGTVTDDRPEAQSTGTLTARLML
jgi:hypothetical protein